jgi:hypothetical protein
VIEALQLGLWPVAGGRWPVAGGRWPVAGGRCLGRDTNKAPPALRILTTESVEALQILLQKFLVLMQWGQHFRVRNWPPPSSWYSVLRRNGKDVTFEGDKDQRRVVMGKCICVIVVPISSSLVTLMMEAIRSSETLVLTRASRRIIPGETFLHVHRRENPKSYIVLTGCAL